MTDEKSSWFPPILLAALFFVAVLPTLKWLQFSNSMENLNVATALELRRGGPILVPTLEGVPRVVKPPLTAWITAMAIRPSTLAHLDDRDESSRGAAYESLAFDVRWPAALVGALTLLATCALGRATDDARTGLIAAAICASSIFFLRFSRFATTDVILTLWVTVANVFLVKIMLDRATMTRCILAGVALGLAFMSKGPVALVQSLIPALLFVFVRRFKMNWPAIVAGAAVFLVVALCWFALAAARDSSVIKTWLTETNPGGGDRMSKSNIVLYGVSFAYMMPWTIFLIVGLVRGLRPMTYPAFILIVGIVIMSLFHDRKERYILPLVPVASLVAAQGVRFVIEKRIRAITAIHWVVLAVMAFAPLYALQPKIPLVSVAFAWSIAVTCIAILLAGVFSAQRWGDAIVVATIAIMFALQLVAMRAYSRTDSGRSDMLPLAREIREKYPDAEMFNWRRDGLMKRSPVDLSIYLNRITKWTADPTTLPPSNHPQVYVTLQQAGEPEPTPALLWRHFSRVQRDKDLYVAAVRSW